MTWPRDDREIAPRPSAIGPGRLVLVVGPSGAGKDTLIAGARVACRSDSSVVFPRRVVTRPASSGEDHDTLSEGAFDQAAAEGTLALWWSAHGLKYGIPRSIDDDIRANRTAVCNVSRTIVPVARERYAHVAVVLIIAPEAVLTARLAARGRLEDGDIGARIARSATVGPAVDADFVITNTGRPEIGIRRLVNVICAPRLVIGF